jgi:hypothetical protein
MRPKADAYVSAAARAQNFGRARELKADSSPTVRTYITFDVSLRSGPPLKQVSLLLYSRSRSQAGYQIRLVAERWRERKITFANAPALPQDFVPSGPLRANAWKAVDVTSLLTGDERYVGFVLTTVSAKGVAFPSRETKRHGPRIILERQEDETTSSSTTTTTGDNPGEIR